MARRHNHRLQAARPQARAADADDSVRPPHGGQAADRASVLGTGLPSGRQGGRRLDQLGAIVFGESVRFDVDDDLNVVSRTVEGVTVPRDALSGGAKEQLGLISRLAVATLVDEADGVPVIIDDALGYSDPDRIAAMASVLTEAAHDAQVIVLTCSPHRYAGVRDAHVVTV